jgi:hypothetical protein
MQHVAHRASHEVARLRAALQEIANLTPEMIDVMPLDRAFSTVRQMTKIARDALKQ